MALSMREKYEAGVADGSLTRDPAQEALIDTFDRIADALANRPIPKKKGLFRRAEQPALVKGLYLWGGVGRGKSFLMDLFFETVPLEAKRRVHFHAFMQDVQAALDRVRKTGVDDAILPVAEEIADATQLLCFDEMQITDIADAMIVGRLFERLFARGVVVVTTSNREPSELYKDGLNRHLFLPFIGMLEAHLEIREIATQRDYRRDRISGRQVYFHPLGREARAQMDAIWQDLTQGASDALTLRVKGRDVHLPGFHNGAGRARFHDLCGLPLGPADYLAVADAVRVLLLDDIPRLSSENYNEARRFVTLIDALYEARVQLIASAADRPDALYLEGAGAFEFERTASRLLEMQSDDWIEP